MKTKNKIAYGIAGLLAFLPLTILVIFQSIFALEASFDSKLVINADEMTIVDIIVYDNYNNDITELMEVRGEDFAPVIYSIIEATTEYVIIDFHGGEIAEEQIKVSNIQFVMADDTKTELLNGIVYLKFQKVAMEPTDVNYARDVWLRDFIEDMRIIYKAHFEEPVGTISYVWVKIITASIGTIIGIATVALVILRKSTKALVKRYWRVAVLVALIEGTIILGLITWIVADIFQVFAAATVGWIMFLGTEKLAIIKGYIETSTLPSSTTILSDAEKLDITANVEAIVAKFKR